MEAERRPSDLVCVCGGVTQAQIEEAIAQDPSCDVRCLGRLLGCGVQCGSCVPLLQDILGNSPWFEVDVADIQVVSGDACAPDRIGQVRMTLKQGLYPASKAGQHVLVQVWIVNQWVSRTFTLAKPGQESASVTILIRRVHHGLVTRQLLDTPVVDLRVRVSCPLGAGFELRSGRTTVCLVGGVGVSLAMSLLHRRPPDHTFHLDYSSRTKSDFVPMEQLLPGPADTEQISHTLRAADVAGFISAADIQPLVRRFGAAEFYLCGPQAFVETVESALKDAGVCAARVHVERYFLVRRSVRAQTLTWKQKTYRIGALLALLPLCLLLPGAVDWLPSYQHNLGHEKLECQDCHVPAPGSMRQQLQSKAAYLLGTRDANSEFMFKHVDNAVCVECHRKPKDTHPAYRFLEPRFEAARQALAPQRCVSCHREHTGTRVSLVNSQYCSHCHGDLKMKNDPVDTPHDVLVQEKRWDSCLGCHDFHGNHERATPKKMAQMIERGTVLDYFAGRGTPYGPVHAKARQPEKKQ